MEIAADRRFLFLTHGKTAANGKEAFTLVLGLSDREGVTMQRRCLNGDIETIHLIMVKTGGRTRLGIEAAQSWSILRDKLLDQPRQQQNGGRK